jgi:hypothetical protein
MREAKGRNEATIDWAAAATKLDYEVELGIHDAAPGRHHPHRQNKQQQMRDPHRDQHGSPDQPS